MTNKLEIIQDICHALLNENLGQAKDIASRGYPPAKVIPDKTSYSRHRATRIFIRDGFIDRYAGAPLLFPGTLMLLNALLPDEFPYHPHWKMSVCHPIYWEFWPILDHVVPRARGGKDHDDNLVTTSALRNSAKLNWTLEELGWELLPPGDVTKWDGLMEWFVKYIDTHRTLLEKTPLRAWRKAAQKVSSSDASRN